MDNTKNMLKLWIKTKITLTVIFSPCTRLAMNKSAHRVFSYQSFDMLSGGDLLYCREAKAGNPVLSLAMSLNVNLIHKVKVTHRQVGSSTSYIAATQSQTPLEAFSATGCPGHHAGTGTSAGKQRNMRICFKLFMVLFFTLALICQCLSYILCKSLCEHTWVCHRWKFNQPFPFYIYHCKTWLIYLIEKL